MIHRYHPVNRFLDQLEPNLNNPMTAPAVRCQIRLTVGLQVPPPSPATYIKEVSEFLVIRSAPAGVVDDANVLGNTGMCAPIGLLTAFRSRI